MRTKPRFKQKSVTLVLVSIITLSILSIGGIFLFAVISNGNKCYTGTGVGCNPVGVGAFLLPVATFLYSLAILIPYTINKHRETKSPMLATSKIPYIFTLFLATIIFLIVLVAGSGGIAK